MNLNYYWYTIATWALLGAYAETDEWQFLVGAGITIVLFVVEGGRNRK